MQKRIPSIEVHPETPVEYVIIDNVRYRRVPFDLNRAMNGAILTTYDGRRAWFLAYNQRVSNEYSIVAHVEGEVRSCDYYGNGRYIEEEANDMDLFIAEPIKEITIYIHELATGQLISSHTELTGLTLVDTIIKVYQV